MARLNPAAIDHVKKAVSGESESIATGVSETNLAIVNVNVSQKRGGSGSEAPS